MHTCVISGFNGGKWLELVDIPIHFYNKRYIDFGRFVNHGWVYVNAVVR